MPHIKIGLVRVLSVIYKTLHKNFTLNMYYFNVKIKKKTTIGKKNCDLLALLISSKSVWEGAKSRIELNERLHYTPLVPLIVPLLVRSPLSYMQIKSLFASSVNAHFVLIILN